MAVSVKVTATGIDPAIRTAIKMQSSSVRRQAVEDGGLSAVSKIKEYYDLGGSKMWTNPSLPTHGAGRVKSQWWRTVSGSWGMMTAAGTGVTLRSKGALGFSHKVTGGTITARRKKFLTIPIVPEAHNISARDYSRRIAPLFAVKGVLAQADENSESGIKPVFVLKRSVTHKPWRGALPPDKLYVDAFARAALESILLQAESAT